MFFTVNQKGFPPLFNVRNAKKYLVHIPLEYWLSRMQNKVKFLYIMGEKIENRRFFVRIYQDPPFDYLGSSHPVNHQMYLTNEINQSRWEKNIGRE